MRYAVTLLLSLVLAHPAFCASRGARPIRALASGSLRSAIDLKHYRERLLSLNPVVYYRLDETSGTTAKDLGSAGATGTYVGTPTLGTAGALTNDGNVAMKPGANAKYMTIGQVSSLNFTGAFSWVLFCKFPTSVSAYRMIFYNFDVTNAFGWGLQLKNNDQMEMVIGGQVVDSDDDITTGNWQWLAFTYAGGGGNGNVWNDIATPGTVEADTAAINAPSYTSAPTAYVGHRESADLDLGNTADAEVDEVAAFNYQLTTQQLQALLDTARGTFTP